MKEQIEEEIAKLREKENVRAVAIVGSYARNPDKETHNDIDILIIIDENWRKRETQQLDNNLVLEKFYNSRKWFQKYIDESISSEGNWNAYHWLENADIKHDPEDLFEDLREDAEEKKEECFGSFDEDEFLYYIWDYQQDMKTNDVGQKRLVMYKLFNYLVNNHFIQNKQPLVKDNYKLEQLKSFDGYMYKNAQEFLTESSTMKKEEKIEKMIKHATRGMGKPGPEWKTDKEKLEE